MFLHLSECVLCCPLHILNKSRNGWGSTKIRSGRISHIHKNFWIEKNGEKNLIMFCPSWIWRSSAYITICFRFSPSISFKLFLVHLLGVVVKFTLLYNILLTAMKFSRIANLARPSNISNNAQIIIQISN